MALGPISTPRLICPKSIGTPIIDMFLFMKIPPYPIVYLFLYCILIVSDDSTGQDCVYICG
jgi:hypothetical protein